MLSKISAIAHCWDGVIFLFLSWFAVKGYHQSSVAKLLSTKLIVLFGLLSVQFFPFVVAEIRNRLPHVATGAPYIASLILAILAFFAFLLFEALLRYIVRKTVLTHIDAPLSAVLWVVQGMLLISLVLNLMELAEIPFVYAYKETMFFYDTVAGIGPKLIRFLQRRFPGYFGLWVL